MAVLHATSRVSYTLRLNRRLQDANVDLAWLYVRIDADTQGRIAARLSHPAFGQPEELCQNGYPAEQIAQAEHSADHILEESARYIISLFEDTKRTWVEPEPTTEGLHEAEEFPVQSATATPVDHDHQPLDHVA